MKVLLVFPPYFSSAVAGAFPLGIGYLAAVLRNHNIDIRILDLNSALFPKSENEIVNDLLSAAKDCDIIGFGGMVTAYKIIKKLIKVCKNKYPDKKIIVGGTLISCDPSYFFPKLDADFGIAGEAEDSLPKLIKAIETNDDYKSIPGLVYNNNGEIVHVAEQPLSMSLDELPFPAWDLFNIEKYIRSPMIIPDMKRSMNIITSRGCPFRCNFCYRNFGRSLRQRSIKNVIEEIEFLYKHYKVHHIEISDELFLIKEERVIEFCEELIRKRIKITWRALARASTLCKFSIETMKLMKRCGNHWIGIGVESGSPVMLKKMHKELNPDQVIKVSKQCKTAGIRLGGTFIIGYPGETENTIQESVDLCKKTGLLYNPFFIAPYPGTELFNEIKTNLSEKEIDELINAISNDVTELQINLTDFPDDKLKELKHKATKEVSEFIGSRNPIESLKFTFESRGIYGIPLMFIRKIQNMIKS